MIYLIHRKGEIIMEKNLRVYTDKETDTMDNSDSVTFNLFGIVTADYLAFTDDMPLIDRTYIVTEQFKDKLLNWFRNNTPYPLPETYVVKDSQVLILWKNAPTREYLSDCVDHLIMSFCQKKISELEDEKEFQFYIDSADTLAMGDMSNFIRRLYLLYSINNIVPTFMESDTIFRYDETQIKTELSRFNYANDSSVELNKGFEPIVIAGANSFFYEHLMEIFKNLLISTNALPDLEKLENNFISLYFKWQYGNKEYRVRDCCALLGTTKGDTSKPMSKSSFYGLVENFEKSPLYAEYLKIYSDLIDIPRTGVTPDILKFMEDYNNTVKDENDIAGKLEMCRRYNFVSLIDLQRNYLSYKKKSESTRRTHK